MLLCLPWVALAVLLISSQQQRVNAQGDTVIIKGSHFFYNSSGEQFLIRGVVYQDQGHFAVSSETTIDPFGDGPTCQRDIAYFQELGLNTVRAYVVDPSSDHSDCMQALADAGIYVIAELGGHEDQIIDRDAPSWTFELFDRYTSVIDAFHNYTNVLGFFAGNEVINASSTSSSAAFIKAAVRDTKRYIKEKGYRQIPIGYSSADVASIQSDIATYLNCGNEDESIDMLGLTLYSWCGDSSLTQSGYSEKISDFRDYPIPVFLSEFGCNIPSPREFTEIQAIYGNQMTSVFSGGIVYQYFYDPQDYGLVSVYGPDVTTAADFSYLSSQFQKISPSTTDATAYTPTNEPSSCPASGLTWSAVPTLPPTPYPRLCDCMMQTLTCVLSSSNSSSSSGAIVQNICGTDSSLCSGITGDGSEGVYGAFSMCNQTEQLSFILNQLYGSQQSDESTCLQNGGEIQSPVSSSASDCSIMLRQAGAAGTGTVTSTPIPPSSAGSSTRGSTATAGGAGSGGDSSSLSTDTASPTPGSSSGLSTGAKAGIGIGAAAAVIIILLLAFLLWRQRKKQKKPAPPVQEDEKNAKPELGDTSVEVPHLDGLQVASGTGVVEHYKPFEMPHGRVPHEMPGNSFTEPVELAAHHGHSEAYAPSSPRGAS